MMKTITEFTPARIYLFTPKDDITPLEAAWISHVFLLISIEAIHSLDNHLEWSKIERHFTETQP